MRVAHVGGGALFLIKFLVGGGLRLVDTGGGEVVGEAGITLRGRRVYVGCLFSNRNPFPSFTSREALLLADSLFPQTLCKPSRLEGKLILLKSPKLLPGDFEEVYASLLGISLP